MSKTIPFYIDTKENAIVELIKHIDPDKISGNSSWKLLAEGSFDVTSTSTAGENVGILQCGDDLWTDADIILVHVRCRNSQNGYFYGSDAIFVNSVAANGTGNQFMAPAVQTIRVSSDGTFISQSGTWGVYGYGVETGGKLIIYARYSQTNSLIIDDTFDVSVYRLALTEGMELFGVGSFTIDPGEK